MKYLLVFFISALIFKLSFGQIDSSNFFELNRGKLLKPITKGYEIFDNENLKHYESYQFDSTLRVYADSSFEVKAIFEGRVVLVEEIENSKFVVITEFGSYFLTYINLNNPIILVGEYIRKGQVVGLIAKDLDGKYFLELMLSNGLKELSLKKWIKW